MKSFKYLHNFDFFGQTAKVCHRTAELLKFRTYFFILKRGNMTYQPEKKINVIDQIRINLINKGMDPKKAKILSREWGLKK